MSSVKGIGDPTVMGWTVCFLYALGGTMALIEARRCHANLLRDRHFWFWGGIGLVLLSLNKQIDSQTLLIDVARTFTKEHQLWEQRRVIQLTTVGFLIGFWAVAMAVFFDSLKALKVRYPLAVCGYAFIGSYIMIRAFCINHVERFVGLYWKEAPTFAVIELAGIVCVILQLVSLRSRSRSRLGD